MESGVAVLVLLGDLAAGAEEDPGGPGVAVPGRRVERGVAKLRHRVKLGTIGCNTHIVLDVGPAAPGEKLPDGLVVPGLAAEVEGGQAAPVSQVHIGPGRTQQPQSL